MNFIQNIYHVLSSINLFVGLILTSVIYFLKQNNAKSELKRCAVYLDGPKSIPFFGNSLTFISHPKDVSSILNHYTRKYGSRYRLWIGEKLSVVLSDAIDIQNTLMNSKLINKGNDFQDLFGEVFKNSTFSSEGAKWQYSRKTFERLFKRSVLEDYIEIMNEEVQNVMKEFSTKASTFEYFDISDYMATVNFNIICRTLFNLKKPATKEQLFAFREANELFSGRSFILMFYPNLIRNIKRRFEAKKLRTKICDVDLAYSKVILEGKLNSFEDDKDYNGNAIGKFIDYLQDDAFCDEDKKAEIVAYSVGGSETITVTLAFVFLMLALYDDVQEKIYEEQKHIFGDSDRLVTVDDIKQMDYLERVMKEVMRLFPLVPFIFRTTHKDIMLDGLTLPANTELIYNIDALHMNPKYFPNPEAFDPERFTKERFECLPKGCYLPFSIGPRKCIGTDFAMYEMKIICSTILRKYRICTTIKKENIKLINTFIQRSADGYKILLSERNN